MQNYLEVANSNLMFFLCFMVILVVVFQSVLFIRKAWKQGVIEGIDTQLMKKSIINSAIFSIVPSLPILIMLMVLTNALGRYFPWLRLSVVGSAAYESMAANLAATSVGLTGFTDPNFDLPAFTTAIWVMSFGIVWGIVFNIIFMKSLDKFSKKMKAANNNFVPVVSGALFIGMLALMSSPFLTNFANIPAISAFIGSAIAVIFCGKIATATKIKAIGEFSLPISLLIGMAVAIITTNIIA